ncbi:MAG TPA: RNA polymerase sigma factor [Verrucomicrobiae bacterium]|jgi:RNA polymerase sigma-70 factor (ECF subfamily)
MNDEQLVTALNARDPAATQELLDVHGDRLLRSAYVLCGNETEAQDLVQETFLQAIRSVHRFQGRSSIYTWLHAILLNLSRHHRRSQKRLVYDDDLIDRETADENPVHPDAGAASSALRVALQQLSAPHREVIVLRYYESLKIHEIAAHLGISKGTVKSRLHYALEQLQTFLPGELNLFGPDNTEEIQKQ